MKPRRRRGLALGLLLLASVLAVLFTVRRDPEPTELLLMAENYLGLARESRAPEDAPATYEKALRMLQEARSSMLSQYGRPAFLRSYGSTRQRIGEAHKTISLAIEEARKARNEREAQLAEEVGRIGAEAQEVRQLLLRLPPRYQRALRHVVSAESRLALARARLTSRESREALGSMTIARAEVSLALRDVRGLLLGFLERRSEWNQDLRETLAWTRRTGGTALVVDKLNHRAHLVRNGSSVREFPAEFGPGWLDVKVREGDRATPEGRYQVVKKKNQGQTRYYRALLINYPNGEDSVRFRSLKAQGVVPRSARIGGLIEVHGNGGKGEDWTYGCVSLRDRDIDVVYSEIGVGSPVTIVGLWHEPTWLGRVLETASR